MAKALITGASRGIGREIAVAMARAGHKVVATMRNPKACDLADLAERDGLSITLAELDVDDDASVGRLFATGLAAPDTLDILVNNAGILSINALEDEPLARMQAVMNTNFFGTVRCMQAVAPAMRVRRSGLIINISSISGRMSTFGQGAYAASKHAVEAMSEAAAQELSAFGVRVALVEPGIIATDMAMDDLPTPRSDSAYPHAGRMRSFYAATHVSGPPPSVVADAVLDIVSGRTTAFRTVCGPDAAPFLGLRASVTDEAWIGLSDTLDDAVFFERFKAARGG